LVHEKTVGQYTVLKDRNGERIFEGDIVCWKILSGETVKGTVEFSNGCFFVVPRFTALHTVNNYCEVIGNIHDNPELLDRE
jgi:uncharacterized phage protein (TIGR01671 family)